MSDSTGRGGGAGPPGKAPARKFAPTVPSRRKVKAEEGAPGSSGADAAANSDVFKDLIGAARSEAGWEKGRGRGRGRGQQQQAFQVTFGAINDRRPLPAARSGAPGSKSADGKAKSSTAGGGSGGGSAGGGGGGGGGAGGDGVGKGGGASGSKGPGGAEAMHEDLPEGKFHVEDKKMRKPFFNYSTYYPTTVPMRMPAEEESEEDEEQPPPVPTDLSTTQDEPENTAHVMGLSYAGDSDEMFLVQVPQILPIGGGRGVSVKEEGVLGGTGIRGPQPGPPARKAAAGTAGSDNSSVTAAPSVAAAAAGSPALVGCSLRELPSGKIGKLLVFRSGKVKLQIGDVLMDVSPGLPMQHHMDVAAINMGSKNCVILGNLIQRLVVSPDVFQLMADAPVPEYRRDIAPEFATVDSSAAAANGTANGVDANGHLANGHASKDGYMDDVDVVMADTDGLAAKLLPMKDIRVKDES